MRDLQGLLALVGSADEIAPVDAARFSLTLGDVITGACTTYPQRSEAPNKQSKPKLPWSDQRGTLHICEAG